MLEWVSLTLQWLDSIYRIKETVNILHASCKLPTTFQLRMNYLAARTGWLKQTEKDVLDAMTVMSNTVSHFKNVASGM